VLFRSQLIGLCCYHNDRKEKEDRGINVVSGSEIGWLKGKRASKRVGGSSLLSTSVLFICFRRNGLKEFVCCTGVCIHPSFHSFSLSLSLFFSLSRVLYFPLSDCLRLSSTPGGGLCLRDGMRERIGNGQMERAFMPAIRALPSILTPVSRANPYTDSSLPSSLLFQTLER